jgi:hypothetical protein
VSGDGAAVDGEPIGEFVDGSAVEVAADQFGNLITG